MVGGEGESNKGRVEVLYDGTWAKMCFRYNSWDIGNAKVACRQLGFAGALEVGRSRSRSSKEKEKTKMVLLYCMGNENSLNECSHRMIDYQDSDWCDDAVVLCLAGNNNNPNN